MQFVRSIERRTVAAVAYRDYIESRFLRQYEISCGCGQPRCFAERFYHTGSGTAACIFKIYQFNVKRLEHFPCRSFDAGVPEGRDAP
jgi:hypothetical protein